MSETPCRIGSVPEPPIPASKPTAGVTEIAGITALDIDAAGASERDDRAAEIQALLETGWERVQDSEPAEAIRAFQAVLALMPLHIGALNGLAAAYFHQGRREEELEVALKAARIAPEIAGLQVQAAQLLGNFGRWDEAAAAFQIAQSIDPSVAGTYASLGATLKQRGEENETIAALQAKIELAPGNPELRVDLGHLLFRTRRPDEAAEAAFRAALTLAPHHAGALVALTTIFFRRGRLEEAINLLRDAIAHVPGNMALQLRLGQLLEERHEIAAARTAFAAAARINPGNATAQAGLRRTRDPDGLFALFENLLGPNPREGNLAALAGEMNVPQTRLNALLNFARDPRESGIADLATTPIEQALLQTIIVAAERHSYAQHHLRSAPLPRLQVAHEALDAIAETRGHESWSAVHWLNAFKLRQIRPSRRAAVVATMRDEGPYLLEWVAHYRVLGFDTLFIYSNDNLDGSEGLLRSLAEHGVITYIDNKMDPARPHDPQQKVYAHALHLLPELWEHEWALVIDGDEFLVPAEHYGFSIGALIDDALAHFPARAPSAICFNWFLYFSGYVYAYEQRPLCRRFPHGKGRPGIKSLVRLRDIISLHRVHYPNIPPDGFLARADFTRLDWSLRQKKLDPVFTSGRLAHYWCKSFEEFAVKKARGDALTNHTIWKREFKDFFTFTNNARETPRNYHPAPESLIRAVEAEMEMLRALPGVASHLAKIEEKRRSFLEQFEPDGGLPAIYESVKAAVLGRD
ncbi:tetratricopeptide repeat protein [Methylocystis sp. ATCC 49242]|uniref:tetratricopeptide repeat protein n=1 Tax=Methylocystis sp. ATCC 49242 TaxID=622637 RepID=UPI0001F87C86|nr:tetratricopeptide repeat protein [Methylocystis sp. ATCC 49242]